MVNKKFMILAIFLVNLLAVSAVSAADNVTGDIASAVETTHDVVSIEENQEILRENNDVGTFDELSSLIGNASNGDVLELNKDYKYDSNSYGVISIKKEITINGNNHEINANKYSSIFSISSKNVVLKNIKFTNGLGDEYAGAIYGGNNLNLINCSFINNAAPWCGALIIGSNNKIINCTFINNKAYLYEGAMRISGDNNEVINCKFINNTAKSGIGAVSGHGKNDTLINCTFSNNIASSYGSAVAWFGFYGNILDCNFISNRGASNVVSWAEQALWGKLINSTFISNSGSSISWDGENGYIADCKFLNNTGNIKNNGAIFIKRNVSLSSSNYTFDYNHPTNVSVELINVFDGFPSNSIVFFEFNKGTDEMFYDTHLNNNVISLSDVLYYVNIGNWEVTARFKGDDNYYPCNTSFTITVNPIASYLTLDNANTTIGKAVNLMANVFNIDDLIINEGTVTFFDGKTFIGEEYVEDGVATLTYTPTTAGEHTITAVFSSDNYLSSNDAAKLLVDSATVEVLVDRGTVGFNSTFIANVKGLYSTINEGTVDFYIDNEYIDTIPVVNGFASVVYTPLIANDYTVKAIFWDSPNFLDDEDSAVYIVNKADSILTAKYDDSNENIVAVVKDLHDNPISGILVGFDIDGVKYISTDSNGQAMFSTRGLAKKEYSVNVMAYANERYKDSNKETVTFDLSKISTILTASDVVTDYNGGKYFTATLKDTTGKAVKDAIVTLKIGSVTRVLYTGENGQVSLTTDGLIPDTYTATVTFDGDNIYDKSSATAKVTVNKLDTILTAEYDAVSKNIVANVKDAKGKPVSGIMVTFSIDGIKYIATDPDGQAKYSTRGLDEKAYSVDVMTQGNNIYEDSNKVTVTFDLSKISTTLTASDVVTDYDSGKNLVATLKDANGKVISGAKVTIKLGTATETLTTDKNGQVSLTTDGLIPDTYVVTISFAGNDVYDKSSATAEVTINKLDTILTAKYDANSKNIVATVKDSNDNPIKGLRVGFALNGVKYVVTDVNGQVKYSAAGLADGTYEATVMACDNGIYKDSNKETVTFTIGSKEMSKIFLRNALYFVTQTKLVQVTLWDGNNHPLAGKTVSIRAYDSVWRGVTDENGDAFVRVGIGFGTHDATVSFDGDDQYNASTRAGYIRVIKQTPSVMVRGADTMFKANDNNKIVKVHLRDRYDKALPEGSKIVIKLNGKTYVGTTDINGVAHIKISINTVGTFTAQAMYGGNTAYNPVTRDVKIRIV